MVRGENLNRDLWSSYLWYLVMVARMEMGVSQRHEEAVEFGGSSSGVDSGHLGSSPSSHTPSAAPVPSSSICKWSPSPLPALTLCGFKS